MEEISFIKYSPKTSGDDITAQVVECYRQVFADKPWHEWKKCTVCNKYWGIQDSELLENSKFQHCGVPLVDFWTRDQVKADLLHEITDESSCWLAVYESKVIGFCWGYPTNLDELQKKLGIEIDSKSFSQKELIKIGYQDEIGVLSEFRRKGVAKTLVKLRLSDFLRQGLEIGLVRTREKPQPSETFLWYEGKLGYEAVARYPDNDGRVILARRLDDDLSSKL